ncbi:SDR family oxidoreductase [Mycolicibacterium aichiense]|uniref:3-beta hydroxysteroid dehydrogenase n=1 Tax=Mycolicibacterium aichiense TaxID=1799 RepID=A0AAD1HQS6_9MYCO|nr:SDR family oxidoreductase [Mycolicibacterium aichiense]MCV7016233.1 SDR family oxidoreductase [Mycolicibacterium aichiense]BBX10002.1 3-beta hydroxysteroid dehydrogenase [Mycolicibacterium aichiense]STZ26334.1 nucleoside-diphosphate-sugar epimerase [Mycolicibacterium aichiense]
MKIFVTGASGWVGSAVVPELLAAGHQVLGLARSDKSADAVAAAGADVHRGDLTDLDSLRSGATDADAVIHLAFHHDFDNFTDAGELDRAAITALGETLADSGQPLVVTSGTAGHAPGQVLREDQTANPQSPRVSEQAALAFADRGVRVSIVRLAPSVHGNGDYGFVPHLVGIAREKGISGYVGDGANRWSAVHRDDAAHLFRLAVEGAPAGTVLHATGEEGVTTRAIAETIGRGLGVAVTSVPAENAMDHFGWIAGFFSLDMPAGSAVTRERFGWQPTGIGLLEDMERHYF